LACFSFRLLFFNKSYRHIDFVKIARIPLLIGRQNLVNGSKNHTGSMAVNIEKTLIFLKVF